MSKHIKSCLVCGSKYTHCEQYYTGAYDYYTTYRIVCDDCEAMFSNRQYENSEEQTIEWFNNLPRKDR